MLDIYLAYKGLINTKLNVTVNDHFVVLYSIFAQLYYNNFNLFYLSKYKNADVNNVQNSKREIDELTNIKYLSFTLIATANVNTKLDSTNLAKKVKTVFSFILIKYAQLKLMDSL